jgi:dihydroorotate dehydrogenase electron transfer subunit
MMMADSSESKKGVFDSIVSFNKHVGERFYRLGLEFWGAGAAAFGKVVPGQFAQVELSTAAVPPKETIRKELSDSSVRQILLRRPFSFCNVSAEGSKTVLEILYCAVGPASLRMTMLAAGNHVSVIGPLGRGFWVPEGKQTAFFVVGGMGVGPLEHLAKVLTVEHPKMDIMAFAGAKTAKALPFERRLDEISQELGFSVPEFARYGVRSLIATDDGTAGYAGLVSDCFADWLGKNKEASKEAIIYACGPDAMLAKVARVAREKGIDCQVSTERMMACGIGVCQSCAVECKVAESSETVYKLCCKDGPVFNSSELVFSS